MKVAIIILNYNSSSDCHKCVSYIKQQICVDYEIIIVDNCSHKNDYLQVEQLSVEANCILLKSSINCGYSAGNNIGLRYAMEKGYEYALIINPDVEIHQTDYLKELLNKIESDNNIVVIGSDIVNVEGSHQNPLKEIGYWRELFWIFNINRSYTADYRANEYCEKLSGCCFIIRLSFVKQIGFLDENTFLYCEEPILAKQVQMAEKKMYYLAYIQAKHVHIKSNKENAKNRIELSIKSRIYYLTQYSGYSKLKLKLLIFSKKMYLICLKLYK